MNVWDLLSNIKLMEDKPKMADGALKQILGCLVTR